MACRAPTRPSSTKHSCSDLALSLSLSQSIHCSRARIAALHDHPVAKQPSTRPPACLPACLPARISATHGHARPCRPSHSRRVRAVGEHRCAPHCVRACVLAACWLMLAVTQAIRTGSPCVASGRTTRPRMPLLPSRRWLPSTCVRARRPYDELSLNDRRCGSSRMASTTRSDLVKICDRLLNQGERVHIPLPLLMEVLVDEWDKLE